MPGSAVTGNLFVEYRSCTPSAARRRERRLGCWTTTRCRSEPKTCRQRSRRTADRPRDHHGLVFAPLAIRPTKTSRVTAQCRNRLQRPRTKPSHGQAPEPSTACGWMCPRREGAPCATDGDRSLSMAEPGCVRHARTSDARLRHRTPRPLCAQGIATRRPLPGWKKCCAMSHETGRFWAPGVTWRP